ncbi:hypothetical protein [Actibacterium pelagium]|uniref:Uncharacterized protein n=1 Tax=Actibacterium pelagium TaxID=2029103 RepID=A0A917EG16_9RHOB|nr:hypothetical protein [Actibacterium pelagium]GGE36833.1 hypothetical protein GCM10011517_00700 [Actibacterium pelagium]
MPLSGTQKTSACLTKNGNNPAFEGARIGARRVAWAYSSALDDTLNEAKARGIPVVSFVSRSENVVPDYFVTSDNRDRGNTRRRRRANVE